MGINFLDFLTHQTQEGYRPFIVHGPAGCGKSKFAKRAAERIGKTEVVDLLEYFLAHPDLPPIDLFRPGDLRRLLVGYASPEPVILVDNMDFLLNTWAAADRRAFLDLVEHDLRSPVDTTKTFGFFLQSDPDFTARPMFNTRKEPRILSLDSLQLA